MCNLVSTNHFWPFPDNFTYCSFDSTGVVEVLVNSGRQLEAFNLVYAFELTEQFDPVSLLKAYLETRKAQVKAGNTSPAAQVGFYLIEMPYNCQSTDGSVVRSCPLHGRILTCWLRTSVVCVVIACISV